MLSPDSPCFFFFGRNFHRDTPLLDNMYQVYLHHSRMHALVSDLLAEEEQKWHLWCGRAVIRDQDGKAELARSCLALSNELSLAERIELAKVAMVVEPAGTSPGLDVSNHDPQSVWYSACVQASSWLCQLKTSWTKFQGKKVKFPFHCH